MCSNHCLIKRRNRSSVCYFVLAQLQVFKLLLCINQPLDVILQLRNLGTLWLMLDMVFTTLRQRCRPISKALPYLSETLNYIFSIKRFSIRHVNFSSKLNLYKEQRKKKGKTSYIISYHSYITCGFFQRSKI